MNQFFIQVPIDNTTERLGKTLVRFGLSLSDEWLENII
jgi:hypothetical protein